MSYAPQAPLAFYPPTDVGAEQQPGAPSALRRCSVKNCSRPLPDAYTGKMCDVCRGRHRIYASTKRAKRKMEKLVLGLQPAGVVDGQAVFMPPDSPTAAPAPAAVLEPALADAAPGVDEVCALCAGGGGA